MEKSIMLLREQSKTFHSETEVWTPLEDLEEEKSPTDVSKKLHGMRSETSKFLSILH